MKDDSISFKNILALIPQQPPFRFIDEILELDSEHIVGSYTFKKNEYFYKGHFPDNPITPGVILTESMAQVGVVALGIYLIATKFGKSEISKWRTLFTDNHVEYFKPVSPNTKVIIKAEKVFWRRMKLRSKVSMQFEDGTIISEGIVSGLGVKYE